MASIEDLIWYFRIFQRQYPRRLPPRTPCSCSHHDRLCSFLFARTPRSHPNSIHTALPTQARPPSQAPTLCPTEGDRTTSWSSISSIRSMQCPPHLCMSITMYTTTPSTTPLLDRHRLRSIIMGLPLPDSATTRTTLDILRWVRLCHPPIPTQPPTSTCIIRRRRFTSTIISTK